MLDEAEIMILKRMYDKCCEQSSTKKGDLLCSSLKNTKNNVIKKITADECCYKATITDPFIKQLELDKYVALYKPGTYILTSKGVWEVESYYYGLSIDKLLCSINEKYDCGCEKINDRNKIILFATLASHAFSSDSSIKSSMEYENTFMELMTESYNCLSSLGRISITYEKFIGENNSTSKRTVSNIMSNVDKLPGSTYSLFISKNSSYYVSIYNKETIDTESLKTLLSVIFNTVNVDEIKPITEFCKKISSRVCSIFNDSYDAKIENSIDEAIEECLEELAFKR